MMSDYRDIAAVLEDGAYDYDAQRPMLADAMRSGARACRDYQGQMEQIGRLLKLLNAPCLKAAIAKLEVREEVTA